MNSTTTTTETPASLPTPRKARLTDLTPHLLIPTWRACRGRYATRRQGHARRGPSLTKHRSASPRPSGRRPRHRHSTRRPTPQQWNAARILPPPSEPAKRKALAEANRKQAAEQNFRAALRGRPRS